MMRIERIKSNRLTGQEDVDWTFPQSFAARFFEDSNQLKSFSNALLELFYEVEILSAAEEQKCKGSVEAWLDKKGTHLHVIRQIGLPDDERDGRIPAVIQDETGNILTLSNKETVGEYLFEIGLQIFKQSGIIAWPQENKKHFYQLVRNLRQVGDEGISLSRVRDSLTGAKKRLEEQTDKMGQLKAEYDVLRSEWEEANLRQEEARSLQIKIKSLQVRKENLTEKIAATTKIQERLSLLRQNPDYRELRQLQGELARLEEQRREIESALTAQTQESPIDWNMIEGLREECLAWAGFQEEVERLTGEVQEQTKKIDGIQKFLQTSGYRELPENEEQRLRQAEKEKQTAQDKLDRLASLNDEIEAKERISLEESSRLQEFASFAGVTPADERRIEHEAKRLAQWRGLRIGAPLDWVLQEKLGKASIEERLAARLTKYYQDFQVTDYAEFKRQLQEYRSRYQRVETLQTELNHLYKTMRQESDLRRIARSRHEIMELAFKAVGAEDFTAWLSGWKDYQQKKLELTQELEVLSMKKEQQQQEEIRLTAYVEQLRDKVKDWVAETTDIDGILAAVMKLARQLRAKDETEKEFDLCKSKYETMRSGRNMDQLARGLEPLADLEREAHISDAERMAELNAWRRELQEINSQHVNAVQSLQRNRAFPTPADLEKKIEPVKLRLNAYEDFRHALADTQVLLEASLQDWQVQYGNTLKAEAQRIFSRIFSVPAPEMIERNVAEAKRSYLVYRLAIAQLAISDHAEIPLFFFVEEMKETPDFWEEVLSFLHKLSFTRQVIFGTADKELWKLIEKSWQSNE